MELSLESLTQAAALIGVGGVTLLLTIKAGLVKIGEASATRALVDMMREEMERQAQVNGRLSEKLVELGERLEALTVENAGLRAEVHSLRMQIKELISGKPCYPDCPGVFDADLCSSNDGPGRYRVIPVRDM